MDFDLTEEQTLLRNMIEKYTSSHYDPMKRLTYVQKKHGFCEKNWKILADMGMLAFSLKEEWGGYGQSNVELITIMEIFGRSAATDPIIPVVLLAGRIIESAGTEQQKEKWIPKILDGSTFASFAHSEQNSRYNCDALQTKATIDQGQHILNGHKKMALAGAFADVFIISAVNEKNDPKLYLIPKGAEGLTITPYRLVDGSTASDLRFENVIAAPMNGGMDEIKDIITFTRLGICAELLGLMELMFTATLDYIKMRKQFGQELGRFQALQHRMSDHYARLELCRSQLYRAAAKNASDPDWQESITGAKAFISENAMKLGEDSIQIHGAIGTTEELLVGQAFKRVMLISSLFGDSHFELQQYINQVQAV